LTCRSTPWACAGTAHHLRRWFAGRAVVDGPQVEIGGNERYVSVSRAEFKRISRGEGAIEPLQPPLPLP
jgi:thymidine kinase